MNKKTINITTADNNTLSLWIEAVVLILMSLGTVFVFSAGANVSVDYSLKNFYNYTTIKKFLFLPLAVVLMYAVAQIDYRRFSFSRAGLFKSITGYLLLISIILLILTLIIGRGIGTTGTFARRWLKFSIGPFSLSFQPSELAKWTAVIFTAAFLDFYHSTMHLYFKRFIPLCTVIGIIVALIITQDFGTAAFIALVALLVMFIGNVKFWHFLTPLPILLPAFYFAVVTSPTRLNRIKHFFSRELVYQAKQSLIAISTGGIFGKGFGKGICKYGHLPEDTSDFIFAIIAEELGFVGAVFVICMFIILLILGIILVKRCPDRFGKLLAAGIVLTITVQAAINIGVVTVLLPTKGIPLPFISAGGTSMLLSAAAAGILISIAKHANSPLPAPVPIYPEK